MGIFGTGRDVGVIERGRTASFDIVLRRESSGTVLRAACLDHPDVRSVLVLADGPEGVRASSDAEFVRHRRRWLRRREPANRMNPFLRWGALLSELGLNTGEGPPAGCAQARNFVAACLGADGLSLLGHVPNPDHDVIEILTGRGEEHAQARGVMAAAPPFAGAVMLLPGRSDPLELLVQARPAGRIGWGYFRDALSRQGDAWREVTPVPPWLRGRPWRLPAGAPAEETLATALSLPHEGAPADEAGWDAFCRAVMVASEASWHMQPHPGHAGALAGGLGRWPEYLAMLRACGATGADRARMVDAFVLDLALPLALRARGAAPGGRPVSRWPFGAAACRRACAVLGGVAPLEGALVLAARWKSLRGEAPVPGEPDRWHFDEELAALHARWAPFLPEPLSRSWRDLSASAAFQALAEAMREDGPSDLGLGMAHA